MTGRAAVIASLLLTLGACAEPGATAAGVAPAAGLAEDPTAAREAVVLGRRLLGGTAARRAAPPFPATAGEEDAVGRARAAVEAAARRGVAAQELVGLWARGGDGPETADEPEAVRRAQRLLTALGYYRGPVNGRNGPLSGEAIRRFQAIQGMPETGEVTAALIVALRAAL